MTRIILAALIAGVVGLWLIVQLGHGLIYLLLKGDEDESENR